LGILYLLFGVVFSYVFMHFNFIAHHLHYSLYFHQVVSVVAGAVPRLRATLLPLSSDAEPVAMYQKCLTVGTGRYCYIPVYYMAPIVATRDFSHVQ